MVEKTREELFEELNRYIKEVSECRVWGLDLIAMYALIPSTLKKIRNAHPDFEKHKETYLEQVAQRKSTYIKQKMAEYVE